MTIDTVLNLLGLAISLVGLLAAFSHNRWTLERIHSEMRDPDYKLLREALSRAIEDGSVNDQLTECTVNDGSVLSTRVYFNTVAR